MSFLLSFPAPVTLLEGGTPPLHLLPANGFPPETYLPLLKLIGDTPSAATRQVLALPIRPLWQPPIDPSSLHNWSQLSDDLIAGLREHNLRGVIAMGHSFGGVSSLVAAVRAPELFRGLILLDPTIFPQIAYPAMRLARLFGQEVRLPLVKQSLRRRARFASLEAAFTYWRGKRLFHDWSDDVLWAYTRAALVPDEDGVCLRWPPQWEARIYQTFYAGIWPAVRALRHSPLPILFVRGATSEVFSAHTARYIRRLLPQAQHAEIAEQGHLFPMSDPAATAAVITRWLAEHQL